MAFVYTKNKHSAIVNILEKSELSDNFLFVVGGDGTYLRALCDFKYGTIPDVYAFNDGNVGFLLPLKLDKFDETYKNIQKGKLKAINRTRMNVSSHNCLVNNELVIRSKNFRLNKFKIKIDDFEFDLNASEVIIATQSGSTGYSFSLGGPILISNSFLLNCVAPNRCNFRPIVISENSQITVSSQECSGWADGIEIEGEIFSICKGDSFKVFVDDDYNSFSQISEIFNLSIIPKHIRK